MQSFWRPDQQHCCGKNRVPFGTVSNVMFFFVSGPSANSFLLVDNFLLSLRVSCVLLVLSI